MIDAIELIGQQRYGDAWTRNEVIARLDLPICHATETNKVHEAYEAEREAGKRYLFAWGILQDHLIADRITAYVDGHAIKWSFWKTPEAETVIYLGDELIRWADPHRFDKFPIAHKKTKEGRAILRKSDLKALLDKPRRHRATQNDRQKFQRSAEDHLRTTGEKPTRPEMKEAAEKLGISSTEATAMYAKLPRHLRRGKGDRKN